MQRSNMVRALYDIYDRFSECPPIEKICGSNGTKVQSLYHPCEIFSRTERGRKIEKEASLLANHDPDRYKIVHKVVWIHFINLFNQNDVKIIHYLRGVLDIEEVGLTKENARSFLKIAKLVDLTTAWFSKLFNRRFIFKRTTYNLRTEILKLCSPQMQTIESYTMPLDHTRMTNIDYLRPSNWFPDRLGLYAKMIMSAFAQLISLSKGLDQKPQRVYALRGNTASGKSHLAKKILRQCNIEACSPFGVVNPDDFKQILQKLAGLTSLQTHFEVSMGPLKSFIDAILKEAVKFSIVLDTRLTTDEDLSKVLQAAELRKGKVTLIDIDVTLITSILRVLATRSSKGGLACPDEKSMRKGYREIKLYRSSLLKRVQSEKIIDYYNLFCLSKGVTHLVAKKRGEVFTVLSPKLLDLCCKVPSDDELNRQGEQIVTSELIDEAVANKIISEHSKVALMKWKGMTVSQALEKHIL